MSKTLSDLEKDFGRAAEEMEKLDKSLPKIIGTMAVKTIQENFRLQGYDSGSGVSGWVPRSPKTNHAYDMRWGVKGSDYKSIGKLLDQTGNLKASINYRKVGDRSVQVGPDIGLIPYAKRMNEGGGGVPARQYMPTPDEGANTKIQKNILNEIEKKVKKILGGFQK